MINPTLKVDAAQAAYWKGAVSRRELQDVADQQAEVIKNLIARVATYDLALAFLTDKIGAKPEEFQAYLQSKMAEFKAAQQTPETAAPTAPAEPSRILLV